MSDLLSGLPEIINRLFDVLELLVVRVTLLGLVAIGAYALLHRPNTR
jgi:hypothetical protein